MTNHPYLRVFEDPLFPIRVAYGELAVVYNNGRLHSVLMPGVHRRVRNLPMIGRKTVVKFKNTEWTLDAGPVALALRDDELGTGASLSASVDVKVTLKTEPEASVLRAAASRFSPEDIGEQIDDLTKTTIAEHVRRRLGSLSHSQLRAAPSLIDFLEPTEISILDGLLFVQRFTRVDPTYDPNVLAAIQARLDAAVSKITVTGEQDVLDLSEQRVALRGVQVKQIELTGLVQVAALTGLPIEAVQNPEHLAEVARGKQELAATLLREPESLRILIRNPTALAAVLGAAESTSPSVVEPEALEGPLHGLHLAHTPAFEPVLSELALGGTVRGSALKLFVARGALLGEGVLVSETPEELRSVVPELQDRIVRKEGLETLIIHVVPYAPELPRFVEAYYTAVAPPRVLGYRDLRVQTFEQRNDGYLRLVLHVDTVGRARDELLRGEGNRRAEQLQSLLMVRQLILDTV